jgi:hypothetical protein
MALVRYDATTDRGGRSLRDTANTLRGHFGRYRFSLYLFSGAAVAFGFALHWNWLASAGLLRIVLVLPCALMMFRLSVPKIRFGVDAASERRKLAS